MNDYEVRWVVGIPRSGKTYQSIAQAKAVARRRRVPLIFVDSGEVRQFASLPRYGIEDLCRAVWEPPRVEHARFVPENPEEMARLCEAIRHGRDAVVLIDEAAFWFGSHTASGSPLLRLLRSTQHSRTDIFLTTQHLSGDVPAAALSCTSELIVFRCNAPRVLDVLEREYGLDRRQVANLEPLEFIRHRLGFDERLR